MAHEAELAELLAQNRALHKEIAGLKKRRAQSRVDLRKRYRQLQLQQELTNSQKLALVERTQQLEQEITNLTKRRAQSKRAIKRNKRRRRRLREKARHHDQRTHCFQEVKESHRSNFVETSSLNGGQREGQEFSKSGDSQSTDNEDDQYSIRGDDVNSLGNDISDNVQRDSEEEEVQVLRPHSDSEEGVIAVPGTEFHDF
ncbi:unnamed protein product [Calypogeia fissa]